MAQITLEIVIPDNPELQSKIIEAVEYRKGSEDAEGNFTPANLTPAEVKEILENQAKKYLIREISNALQEKAKLQAATINF